MKRSASSLSIDAVVPYQSSCVHHSLKKKWKLKFWPLGGKVLAVCISQLWWEPVFGAKHARVGRRCLCCTQQLERPMGVSLVSGLFPWILLLGDHSGKPSLSVLGFGAVLPAVVFHRKESANWKIFDTSTEPGCQGEFYFTWMDTSILPKIKSLFQCP